MANQNHHRQESQRDSRFQPGITMSLEIGVSFTSNSRPHTTNINYASRSMQEKLARQHRQEEDFYLQTRSYGQLQNDNHQGPHPAPLMPDIHNSHAANQDRIRQQHRSQRLGIRTREQHERGSSAPPTLMERTERLPPRNYDRPVDSIQPLQHTTSFPLSPTERPLPPLPSHFRLGEDSLPWSTEPWYQPSSITSNPSHQEREEEEYVAPTSLDLNLSSNHSHHGEDPQRVRELDSLNQAMMTIDSLAHDGWETWTWESVGDIPRGPRSLGWAVANSAPYVESPGTPLSPGPPPYVVSQHDQNERFGGYYYRPRSSG